MNQGTSEGRLYMSVVGVGPREFHLLVAVMAHERIYGYGPTRRQLEKLGVRVSSVAALERSRWLVTEGIASSPKQELKAAPRCWNNLWPSRMGEPEDTNAQSLTG